MQPFYADIKIEGNKIQFFEKCEKRTRIKIDSRKIESDELFVYPGFRDCHGHIHALGKLKSSIDLTESKSENDIIKIIKKYKFDPKSWIVGRGWNQELWENKQLPTKEFLDNHFPNTPVYLVRVDGHCAVANTKALEIADIDEYTSNPEGGEILKDSDGNLNGLFLDNAMNLVSEKLPKQTHATKVNNIKEGMNQLSSVGVIETHDMDVHPEIAKIFIGLDEKHELKQYIKAYISAQNEEYIKYHITKYDGNSYNICGIKLYADGALGSRGAELFDPYNDSPNHKGIRILDYKSLKKKILLGLSHGFDISIHCIGDKANSLVLDAYSELADRRGNNQFRIEHAQILNKLLPTRFKELDVTASIQSVHCISDAFMAEKRLGNRIQDSYLWKTLIDKEINILPGSDYPIESHNPIIGIDAFVNRIPFNSDKPWQEQERISLDKALSLYYSPISLKDIRNNFIVLNKNIYNIPELEINKIRNTFTMYNSFIRYNGIL